MSNVTKVETFLRASKHSWGITDHYWWQFGGSEYHVGTEQQHRIKPANSTLGGHLYSKSYICEQCLNNLETKLQSKRDIQLLQNMYPLVNCESLTTGFSSQSVFLLALVPIIGLVVFHKFCFALLLFLATLVLYLMGSKYAYSKTRTYHCPHIERQQKM